MSSDRKHSPALFVLACFLTYVILVGLWLLFTSNLAKPELYVGLGAAAIATIATIVFEAVGLIHFRPRFIDLLQAWRLPWYALQGSYEILKGIALQIFTADGAPSIVIAVPYEAVGEDHASAARRALAVGYTTLTPNFVVLGIVMEQRLMLYHQILPGPVLQMTINLGARP
ncbi:MAG TPA: hypothetical protein VFW23_17285 [Tepidisphaeraceae bacterium]|nr:hypothetical protein [Tepidisphaeraceae bacterium]